MATKANREERIVARGRKSDTILGEKNMLRGFVGKLDHDIESILENAIDSDEDDTGEADPGAMAVWLTKLFPKPKKLRRKTSLTSLTTKIKMGITNEDEDRNVGCCYFLPHVLRRELLVSRFLYRGASCYFRLIN